jgi:hypothetical protein
MTTKPWECPRDDTHYSLETFVGNKNMGNIMEKGN